MALQNDALVAQMEGMSEDERQQFLAEQITERVSGSTHPYAQSSNRSKPSK